MVAFPRDFKPWAGAFAEHHGAGSGHHVRLTAVPLSLARDCERTHGQARMPAPDELRTFPKRFDSTEITDTVHDRDAPMVPVDIDTSLRLEARVPVAVEAVGKVSSTSFPVGSHNGYRTGAVALPSTQASDASSGLESEPRLEVPPPRLVYPTALRPRQQ